MKKGLFCMFAVGVIIFTSCATTSNKNDGMVISGKWLLVKFYDKSYPDEGSKITIIDTSETEVSLEFLSRTKVRVVQSVGDDEMYNKSNVYRYKIAGNTIKISVFIPEPMIFDLSTPDVLKIESDQGNRISEFHI